MLSLLCVLEFLRASFVSPSLLGSRAPVHPMVAKEATKATKAKGAMKGKEAMARVRSAKSVVAPAMKGRKAAPTMNAMDVKCEAATEAAMEAGKPRRSGRYKPGTNRCRRCTLRAGFIDGLEQRVAILERLWTEATLKAGCWKEAFFSAQMRSSDTQRATQMRFPALEFFLSREGERECVELGLA